jgi:hypothetical protein
MIRRLLCRILGHEVRSDWLYGVSAYRRPRHVRWCDRCGETLSVYRAKRRYLKYLP